MELTFTEITDARSEIFKKIEVLPNGQLIKTAKATISEGTAKTMRMPPEAFAQYLTDLSKRANTCFVASIWPEGQNWVEYDITLAGQEDPSSGRISRTKEFFKYANSDQVSLMCFDIDGDWPESEVNDFIDKLEKVLFDAIIPGPGTSGTKRHIMQFRKPSPSARVKVNGNVSNGLHIYIPVRNLTESLFKEIFRWAWIEGWPSHMITAAATIDCRSIIDASVAAVSRLMFEADPEVTGATDQVEFVERVCSYTPGGIIDCELAEACLSEFTVSFWSKWQAYKNRIAASPEYQEQLQQRKAIEDQRRRTAGKEPRRAGWEAGLLFEDRVLLSSESLLMSNGSLVSVYDILVDRDTWIGKRGFQDPITPIAGTNKAMIIGDEHSVKLKSFAHGGLFYHLRFDYEGLLLWVQEATEDELLECFGSFASQSIMKETMMDKIINEVKKLTKSTITALRKDVAAAAVHVKQAVRTSEAELEEDENPCFLHPKATQGEIADDMLHTLGECRAYGSGFYVADRSIWKPLRSETLEEKIAIRYAHCDLCKRRSDYTGIAQLVFNKEQAYYPEWRSPYGVPCLSKFLKIGQDVVGSINGVEVKGASFVDYSLDLGCRYKLNFNPDFNMPTPYWDKVLNNVENPRCFQQAFGLALCGYLTRAAQTAMVMKGAGGTGKGTTNRVLTALLPRGCVTEVSLENMTNDKKVIPLVDSVVNIIPEMKRGGKAQSTEGFKMATGGDMIQAWRMYKGPVSFRPNASQIININDWPPLDSAGEEIRRRLGHFIVEFKKNYDEKIDNLDELIIERELPGVLAWAILGVVDYFTNGMDDSYSLQLYEKWVSSFDPTALMLEEYFLVGRVNGERVLRSGLWKFYEGYCKRFEYYPMRKGQFFAEIENRFGPAREVNDMYFFYGLALSDSGADFAKGALGLDLREISRTQKRSGVR